MRPYGPEEVELWYLRAPSTSQMAQNKERTSRKADNLEAFAKRIETRVKAGGDTDSIERLFCRLVTNKKTPQVAAGLITKWVEWRYGKAKETVEHVGEGGGPINHTIRFGDGKSSA